MRRDRSLRAFVKIDAQGNLVPGVLLYRKKKPSSGNWKELDANVCCPSTTTTSTTTTTTTT
jgi:hypothetical protein